MTISTEASQAAVATTTALRWGLVVNHIRQNNVSYLLAVAIAHMLGLLQPVIEYGQGVCA
jgi:hypothetical protein